MTKTEIDSRRGQSEAARSKVYGGVVIAQFLATVILPDSSEHIELLRYPFGAEFSFC